MIFVNMKDSREVFMHGGPDHHDAELMLRLYDLRREEKLRRARDWFLREFNATSLAEMERLCPPGSEQDAYARMTVTYWEMAASIVNHGLIHEKFFFENNGELWSVWEKARPVVPTLRELLKNPHLYENLEILAGKYEKWMAERAPDHLGVRRQRLASRAAPPSGRAS